jgi:AcrR family transcriptional regulator
LVQKYAETEDLRVRRTRKLLQEALIELTVEKGFPAVTVRDITDRAMVNRSTFYRHYLDKYQLLDEYMADISKLTDNEHQGASWNKHENGAPEGVVKLLRHVQKYADFYRVMLGQNGDAAFTAKFRQNTETRFRQLLAHYGMESQPDSPPVDFRVSYISCAAVGAILWWLESGQPYPVEQLAKWLSELNILSAGLRLEPS